MFHSVSLSQAPFSVWVLCSTEHLVPIVVATLRSTYQYIFSVQPTNAKICKNMSDVYNDFIIYVGYSPTKTKN